MLVEVGAERELGVAPGDAAIRFGEQPRPRGASPGPRHLHLDGEPAYELSFWCGTCAFLFQRLGGANQVPALDNDGLRTRLAAGATTIDETVVGAYGALLARGPFRPLLLEVRPGLVWPYDAADYFTHEQVSVWGVESFTGLPQYPATPYYRTFETPVDDENHLYEFVVPMVPPTWNDRAQVQRYAEAMRAGATPCAVAVSILDVTAPAVAHGEDWCWHWGLTHFLLDGHHKLEAAAADRHPVRVLSLLAVADGLADHDQVERALAARRGPAAARVPR